MQGGSPTETRLHMSHEEFLAWVGENVHTEIAGLPPETRETLRRLRERDPAPAAGGDG